MTVVEAALDEATEIPPLFALHEVKENGPVGEVERSAATPLSSQPSPVGEMILMGTVPDLVVVKAQGPPEPVIVVPEKEPPHVFDE